MATTKLTSRQRAVAKKSGKWKEQLKIHERMKQAQKATRDRFTEPDEEAPTIKKGTRKTKVQPEPEPESKSDKKSKDKSKTKDGLNTYKAPEPKKKKPKKVKRKSLADRLKSWALPEIKKGRTEPETNLKNLSTPEYEKAWKQYLKDNPDDPDPWKNFQNEYGTKYDENNNKLKPTEGIKGWSQELRGKAQAGELRANREAVLNFIFEGDTTDITKESKAEFKRSGKKLTAHHLRGLAEDGPWVDKIIRLLEYPEGSKEYKKGVQMMETSRYYMRARGLTGKAGTSLQNLDMVRTGQLEQKADGSWAVVGRNDPKSPHLETHRQEDFHNITADKGTALGPRSVRQTDASWKAGDTGDDIKYEFTSKGVGDQETIKYIQSLPDADTDAFTYTIKKGNYGPEHLLNQEVGWSGKQLNPIESFYSSWADHIETTDPGRVQASIDVRKSVADSGLPDTGTPHFLESRGIPGEAIDPKVNAEGLARGFARLAGSSSNPLVNMGGDIVGTVMDGMAFASDPDAQKAIDLALSGSQVVTNLAALGVAALPVPGARPGAYAIMRLGDNISKIERLWNMQREGRQMATRGRQKLSPFQQQVIDEVYIPTAQKQQKTRLWKGLSF